MVAPGSDHRCPDAAKAPRRVPSRERVGRRIPNTALRNRLAGTGSETSRRSCFAVDCQSQLGNLRGQDGLWDQGGTKPQVEGGDFSRVPKRVPSGGRLTLRT